VVNTEISAGSGLFSSVVAVAFAYEGWIIATPSTPSSGKAKKICPSPSSWFSYCRFLSIFSTISG
jgi:APA family basic amino acid/polyamine antiporter